jgi:hypothetical protein
LRYVMDVIEVANQQSRARKPRTAPGRPALARRQTNRRRANPPGGLEL